MSRAPSLRFSIVYYHPKVSVHLEEFQSMNSRGSCDKEVCRWDGHASFPTRRRKSLDRFPNRIGNRDTIQCCGNLAQRRSFIVATSAVPQLKNNHIAQHNAAEFNRSATWVRIATSPSVRSASIHADVSTSVTSLP